VTPKNACVRLESGHRQEETELEKDCEAVRQAPVFYDHAVLKMSDTITSISITLPDYREPVESRTTESRRVRLKRSESCSG